MLDPQIRETCDQYDDGLLHIHEARNKIFLRLIALEDREPLEWIINALRGCDQLEGR